MKRFRVQQIDHVELFVRSRREAAAWYGRVLGCDIVADVESWARDPMGPLMISSDLGETKLALFRGKPQGSLPPSGIIRVAFRVSGEGFVDFLKRLESLSLSNSDGAAVTAQKVVDHGGAFSIYFCDLDGNALEVTTYDVEAVTARLEGE